MNSEIISTSFIGLIHSGLLSLTVDKENALLVFLILWKNDFLKVQYSVFYTYSNIVIRPLNLTNNFLEDW